MSVQRAKGIIPVAQGVKVSETELIALACIGAENLAESRRGTLVGVLVVGPTTQRADGCIVHQFEIDIEVPG